MSNTDESGFNTDQNNSDSLDLGPIPWTPTPPAGQYVGPMPGKLGESGESGEPGQPDQPGASSSGASLPAYGESGEQEYTNYDPEAVSQPYPSAPPYLQSQMFPPMQPYATPQSPVSYPGTPLVPGQMVQTPYGNFVVGPKSKVAAGVLGIVLGCFGVGRFYRGDVGLGVAQLVVTILTGGLGWMWGFIEGITVLVSQPGSPNSLDSNGQIMT